MAETSNGAESGSNGAEPKAGGAPRLQVLSQFIRDMSFENIAMQKGIPASGKPDIKVQVNLDAQKKADDQYEVALKIKVDSKMDSAQVFLLELDYAGRFLIQNVPDNQLHPLLMIECPRLIFPYLRRIVGDITRDGGYPPMNLETIDFLALYRAEIERQKAARTATTQV